MKCTCEVSMLSVIKPLQREAPKLCKAVTPIPASNFFSREETLW